MRPSPITNAPVPPGRRQPAIPPAPPAHRTPAALPRRLFAGWKRKLAVLVAVALVSGAFGAWCLPGTPAPRCPVRLEEPAPVPAPSAPSEERIASNLVINSRQPPTPQVTLSPRPRLTPIPPQRLPGPAATLAGKIDQHIDSRLAQEKIPASPLADDAEFLRRVFLDLTGHIPTAEQARGFLDKTDPCKRAKLIDDLLADSEFGRHLAEIWTDILIKRDPDNNKGLKTEAFTAWLAEQFNQGRGWNQIVTSLVTAEGREENRPEVLFVLANQDNNQPAPEKLVGAVGNLFMGVQIQCSQCHVHPTVAKWNQKDFWGLAAFFGHTHIEREGAGKNKKGGIATVKDGELAPMAKGKGKGKDKAVKPMPVGAVINIPDPNDSKKITGTARARFFEGEWPNLSPRGSYRPALAAWLTSPGNRWFAPAAVNRFWAHFFSRGFVNPLEEMHEKNPPTHPALLQALAAEFTRSGYDVKLLIRAICNSNAYQRTSRPVPENQNDERLFSRMPVKVLGARELLASLTIATSHQ